jgi:uncharacterized membrane protein YjgN (DUF898 family)
MDIPAIRLPAEPPALPSRLRMRFDGTPRESRSMLVKGALLALPTLGFYRFWLITHLRRWLWQNTRIGDDGFEYTGTARELLLGFLAGLAILAPVYIVYFIIGLESERLKAFASLPLVMFFWGFTKFAQFRARRYRLTRTIFRGVRFTMTGSGLRYAAMWAGWSLLSLVTLGLAYPWQVASLERYKVDRTSWGDKPCRLEAKGWSLFRSGFLLWLFGIVIVGGAAVQMGVEVSRLAEHPKASPDPAQAAMLAGMPFVAITVAGLCWLLYLGIEWRWWINGLRMGDLALSSDLGSAIWLTRSLALLGAVLLWFLAAGLVAALVALLFRQLATEAPAIAIALGAAGYLVVILGIGVIYRQVLVCGFWRIVAYSITLENAEALAGVHASGQASGFIGEGLAEALDVGAF